MQLGLPAMTAFDELYVWAWEGYYLQPPSTHAMATAPFAAKGLVSWKKQASWKWHYTCLFRSGASGLRSTALDGRPVLGICSGRKREPGLSGGVTAPNSKSKWVIKQQGWRPDRSMNHGPLAPPASDERHQLDLGWQNHSMQCTSSLYPPRPQTLSVLRTQLRNLKTRECSASSDKVQALLIMV